MRWREKESAKRLLLNILTTFEEFSSISYVEFKEKECVGALNSIITEQFQRCGQSAREAICDRCKNGDATIHFARKDFRFWHRMDEGFESCPASRIIEEFSLENLGQGPVGSGVNKGAYPPPYPDPYRGVPLVINPSVSIKEELLIFHVKGILRGEFVPERETIPYKERPWIVRLCSKMKTWIKLQSANAETPQPTNKL